MVVCSNLWIVIILGARYPRNLGERVQREI